MKSLEPTLKSRALSSSILCMAMMMLAPLLASAQAGDTNGPGETRMRREAIQRVESDWKKRGVPPQARPAAAKIKGSTERCLPTCDITDGRFFAIAGSNFQTLSSSDLDLEVSVPAGTTTVSIGIFDGDGGEYQSDGETANWDSGVTAEFEYSLLADPLADGTGTAPVELLPGQTAISSSTMPDNDWIDFTVATGKEAQAPSGSYFYVLRIRLLDRSLTTLNAFKVRSSATVSGVSLIPVARPFSYIAPWTALSDISTVYPSFPATTPTTYDGTFRFYFDVPVSQRQMVVWDGDFDHGNFNLTGQDTDDPDTPDAPFLPPWATTEARPEGIAEGGPGGTGEPADDDNPHDFGIYNVRSPAVRYDLVFPDGRVFSNANPSGNREWEQFKISTDPFNASQMDYSTRTIPPGIYGLEIRGVDMLNFNALLLPFRVLCVDEQGEPCKDLPRPYRIGDTVFLDRNGNGGQDTGEPGIPGVVLQLRDFAGLLIGTATTDASGEYRFEVEPGEYTVAVAASSLGPGGALAGFTATTPQQHTDTVLHENILTYDFGYRGTGSLGDRVWSDRNGNGVQDPAEVGLAGVLVELRDSTGNVITRTTTGRNGIYMFTNLEPGTFSVAVVTSTLPADATPTYDLDGTATASTAFALLAPGQNRTDVDFGYRGSICDFAPTSSSVQLLDPNGKLLGTAIPTKDGGYLLPDLPAGTYQIRLLPQQQPDRR